MSIKKIIQGLWIEGELSSIELLTIRSYQSLGYIFHLYTYNKNIAIPVGTVLHDAGSIIPKEEVFQYKNKSQFGHGKGSYAGFSDIFRYKLLYEKGGWWTDMDITCLQQLPDDQYIFRSNKSPLQAIGNIIFCPAKSDVMKYCYDLAQKSVTSDNADWTLPISILNEAIHKFGLQMYIKSFTNNDSWLEVSKMINSSTISEKYNCIHWMNEEWRRLGLDKNSFPSKSAFYALCKKHHIPFKEIKSNRKILKFKIKTHPIYYVLINWRHLLAFLSAR